MSKPERKKVTGTPTHSSWLAMLWRTNPKNKQDFKYYKNVKVCNRWKGKTGFYNFLLDMGERPAGLTLDRKDNLKGYYPNNCKWSDRKEQARNTRQVVWVKWETKEYRASDLCAILGIKYSSVKDRVSETNVSFDSAILYYHLKKILGLTQGKTPSRFFQLLNSVNHFNRDLP